MKITLNNKEDVSIHDLTDREFKIYLAGVKYGADKLTRFIIITVFIVGIIIVCFATCTPASAQSTRPIYRQTLIIKSNKPVSLTWQKVNVNYLDKIYEYDRKLKKRRLVLIVFGKEGTSPISEWTKYEVKEGDTIYNYKREL